MLKLVFEYLTDSYSLLENPVDNYIIMTAVGFIAYVIAYNIVGWFYQTDMIDGRSIGHILHWIIRFMVFMAIYYVFTTVIRIYKWLAGVSVCAWLIILAIIVIATIIVIILKWILNKQRERK